MPRGHRKLLENFVQLKVDNKVLTEESARLASQLAEVQHARGGITTVPVPGETPWLIPCFLLKAAWLESSATRTSGGSAFGVRQNAHMQALCGS